MSRLFINPKYIEIVAETTDDLYKVSTIPYVHSDRAKKKFRTSIKNIDQVLEIFRGITQENIDTAPPKIQKLYDKEMQRRVITKSLIESGPVGSTELETITLFPHQQLAKEIAEVNESFAFFYDTRTGKTPMSLSIIDDDIKKNPHHKWLVLCPLILIENAWLEDAEAMFPHIDVVNLHAPTKKKRLEQFAKKGNLYLSNIESFVTYKKEIEALNIHGCFVDESSTMKSNKSKFGKAAVEYAMTVKRWYLLSGTPAPNGEHEYFRQLQSVDYYGVHQSFARFKDHFFKNVSYNPQYEKLSLKFEMQAEMNKLLRSCSLYVDKEDVLETPGRDFITVPIKMPEQLALKYKELKKELSLELSETVTITAASTAASLNKLNQVTSGFLIDSEAMKHNKMAKANPKLNLEQMETTHLLSNYRFNKLIEMLDEIGEEQVLIWCHYRKEFEILKKTLGDKCACVYGATSLTEKSANIKAFKNGDIQYLIANPASADKGLTLTNAHIAIYFSLGYSYELWKQSIERIYGSIIKQPKRCKYYIITAEGTVDEAIYSSINTKGDLSSAVLNHLKGEMT